MKKTLRGASSGSGDNFIAPALIEREEFRGKLRPGVPAAYTLTGSDVNWAIDAFNLHPAHSHYVEIIGSGDTPVVRLTTDIVRNTATTLTTADDLSRALHGGETFVIRRHKTLAALFGSGNAAGLAQGDSATADTISILTPGTQASFSSFYFRSGTPLGGSGWRSTVNPFVDQSQTPVPTGQGLLIKRKQSEPVELVLHGFVRTGPLSHMLESGYNLVDPLAAVTDQRGTVPGARFTLGGTLSAAIVPSGLGSTLAPGSAQSADVVSIFSSISGFTSYYLAASGPLGSGGWRTTSNPFANMEATVLPPATAFLIQNRGPVKAWTRPQPFVLGTP